MMLNKKIWKMTRKQRNLTTKDTHDIFRLIGQELTYGESRTKSALRPVKPPTL